MPYLITEIDIQKLLNEPVLREKWQPRRLQALLREPRYRQKIGATQPFLQMLRGEYPYIDKTEVIRPESWVTNEWPRSVVDKFDRVLENLAISSSCAGFEIQVSQSQEHPAFLVEGNMLEFQYILNSMSNEYKWITKKQYDNSEYSDVYVTLTPEGWSKYEQQVRRKSERLNPAFVAMDFGVSESDKEKNQDKHKDRPIDYQMKEFFDRILRPAVNAAGYKVVRADSDPENNKYMMDKIRADIRRAPFIVADVTYPNNGVYLEVGFAMGLDIPVIPICKDGAMPHFDVAQLQQVRWSEDSELIDRLTNRILGSSLGEGPFPELKEKKR